MDDPTVNWSKETHDEIESKMVPFLRSSGYNVKKDVQFLPISVEIAPRDLKGPSRMPIIDKFKDMGTVVMGKVESGTMCDGDSLLVMPIKAQVKVLAIYCDEDKAICAGPGENLQVKLSGIEEDVLSGFVLCSVEWCCCCLPHSGEQLDLCLRDSQILHNLEGLLFELKEKQLQWEKSWTFLQVPVHKKASLLEVRPPDSPCEWV
ncbi:hypothetical protein SLE2022_057330 [Rubroshorea leprosula]